MIGNHFFQFGHANDKIFFCKNILCDQNLPPVSMYMVFRVLYTQSTSCRYGFEKKLMEYESGTLNRSHILPTFVRAFYVKDVRDKKCVDDAIFAFWMDFVSHITLGFEFNFSTISLPNFDKSDGVIVLGVVFNQTWIF